MKKVVYAFLVSLLFSCSATKSQSSDGWIPLAKSPSGTMNARRILFPAKPSSVVLTSAAGATLQNETNEWDEATHTLLLRFANSSSGVHVQLKSKR